MRISQRAIALLQFVLETLLTMLLFASQYVLQEVSKGHGSKSKQVTLNGRTFLSIFHLLRGDMAKELLETIPNAARFADMETTLWPILYGALQTVRHEPARGRAGGGGRGRGRGSEGGRASRGRAPSGRGSHAESRGRGNAEGATGARGGGKSGGRSRREGSERASSRGMGGGAQPKVRAKSIARGLPWQYAERR